MRQVLFKSQGKSQNEQKKAVDLEDIKFHQCVRLTRFETDRTISFIPPDGSFDLMVGPVPVDLPDHHPSDFWPACVAGRQGV